MADNFSTMVNSVVKDEPPTSMPGGMPKMETPEEYTKKGEALLKKEQDERKPLVEAQEASIKKMFDLAGRLKSAEAPAAPTLKDMEPAPQSQYRDPTQALGSMGSVLALIGSFKTRRPMTAALNAAAASMKGFHQGDQERVKLEREKWHDNMEAALKQNQIETERYTAALQRAKFDIEKARPEFEAIAAESGHNQMLMATQHQDYQTMEKIYEGARKTGDKMVETYVKDQEFRLRQKEMSQRSAETAAYRKESLQLRRDQMEEKASKVAEKAVAAGKSAERAVEIISEMKGILETNAGVTGIAGMAKRPLESVLSIVGGPESGPAHQYESLARELQNVLRKTQEFQYKGRTLSKEVADRDVIVRGLKFGDTGSISMDQLNHLENMLTGGGTSFQSKDGRQSAGAMHETKVVDGKTYTKINGTWYEQ